MATLAEVVAGLSGTHAEVYDQVSARTVATLLSADKLSLVGLLQTTTLGAGKYLVVARLTKAATSERKEIVALLKLSASQYV